MVVVHIDGTAVGFDRRGKPLVIGVRTAVADSTGLSDVEEPFSLDGCTIRPGIKLFVFVLGAAAFKIIGFSDVIAGCVLHFCTSAL